MTARPPTDPAAAAAWRDGWRASTAGSRAPNPHAAGDALFPAWLAGFFAHADAPPPADAPRGTVPPAAALDPGAVARITPESAMRMTSPAFATRPPTLVNPGLIAPGSRHAMEASWRQTEFPARPINLLRLRNVIVVHEGLVFDDALRVVESTTIAYTEAEVRTARDRVIDARARGTLGRNPAPSVLCKKRAANNYGHFMLEMLPKAFIAASAPGDVPWRYVVHRSAGPIMDATCAALGRLGIGLDRIDLTGGEPRVFEDLLVVDGLTLHGRYMSPLCIAALERLAEGVAPGADRRLFVTRATAPTRRLQNESDLLDGLIPAGFRVINPGAMTLLEQIAAFAGATHVIGPIGAGMSNIAFCPRGARVTMLVPSSMPDTFFWFISQHKGHEYVEIRGPEQSPFQTPPWNATFSVDASLLVNEL